MPSDNSNTSFKTCERIMGMLLFGNRKSRNHAFAIEKIDSNKTYRASQTLQSTHDRHELPLYCHPNCCTQSRAVRLEGPVPILARTSTQAGSSVAVAASFTSQFTCTSQLRARMPPEMRA